MIHWPGALVGCALLIVAGLAVSAPVELREGRWIRIICSVPSVIFISSAFASGLSRLGGSAALVSIFVLGMIWKSVLAHYGADTVTRLIFGNWNVRTGVQADFGTAKRFQKHGDIADAIQHTQWELEKAPASYEGLLLLADLHEQDGREDLAAQALERLLRRGRLSGEQRQLVAKRWRKIEEQRLVDQFNGAR